MKRFIKELGEYKKLYRYDKSGIAIVENGTTGLVHSAHPNIHKSGSVSGMKQLGYWKKEDEVVKAGNYMYNISRLSYDRNDPLDQAAVAACQCMVCKNRRNKASG